MDVLEGKYEQQQAIRPRLSDFEAFFEPHQREKNQERRSSAVEGVYVR